MEELDKMKLGEWYDPNNDPSLIQKRLKAETLSHEFNSLSPRDIKARFSILNKLVGELGDSCEIVAPFYADYGSFIKIGNETFINRNAYFMDGGGICVGSHCYIGPSCGFYTAVHPLYHEDRNTGLEKALSIVIGNNCWLGADVKVMPGVSIGDNVVIGAGSIVTKDIQSNVLAMGNPCRIVRVINDKDKLDLSFSRGDI